MASSDVTNSFPDAAEKKKEDGLLLTDLLGEKAVTPSGESISIATEWVNGKKDVIVLYFSAHWCPPCRKFTPKLSQAYKEYRDSNPDDNFEIVFVSSDTGEDAFKEYHSEMTFPALDYMESRGVIKETLGEKFEVQGIPELVVMDAKTGERLNIVEDEDKTEDTTTEEKWPLSPIDMITHYGSKAFPLSIGSARKCFDAGKQHQIQALQKVLGMTNVLLSPANSIGESESFTFATLMESFQCAGLMLSSKLGLEELPKLIELIEQTNIDEDGKQCRKLAVVYVPNCFPELDEYARQSYKEDNALGLFHFQDLPSQDVIDSLKSTAGLVGFDTLVIMRQNSRVVEECGIGGNCTSHEITEVELVSTDEFVGNARKHGASFFPWDKAQIDLAEAKDKARAAETMTKMKESLECFLVELASEGKVIIGDSHDAAAVADRLREVDDEEGVIGFYFGRRTLTPTLAECFENVNKDPTMSGKKRLEIVFVGEYEDKADFDKVYATMVTPNTQVHFLAIDFAYPILSRAIRGGIGLATSSESCLVLLKKDGTVIPTKEEIADNIESTLHYGFPWNEDGITRGKEMVEAAVKEEDERCERAQKEMRVPVIRRMIGRGANVKHAPDERIIRPSNGPFLTYGMQDIVITNTSRSNYKSYNEADVFYYEIELLKINGEFAFLAATQFGFSSPGALDDVVASQSAGKGCGDTIDSWGVCGLRGELWTRGKKISWSCNKWKEGDVVGLAVNASVGKIAVSVNGSDFTVVFEDDAIKKGVFPCFSFDSILEEIRVNTTSETFKHDGPADEVWFLPPPVVEDVKAEE